MKYVLWAVLLLVPIVLQAEDAKADVKVAVFDVDATPPIGALLWPRTRPLLRHANSPSLHVALKCS